ncbi:MAG: phospholipase D-like domain-containing protein [archaeon]|nr:phospholipase D-like domain-containing protein [archaeon]
MVKPALFLLPVFIIILIIPSSIDGSDGAAQNGSVVFTEVDPYNEGFTITNTSNFRVDLKGYVITDGEGKLTFKNRTDLDSGASLTVVKSKDQSIWFLSRENTVTFSSTTFTKSGSFIIANAGDDLYIYDNNEFLLDTVVFGSASGKVRGWNGDPVQVPNKHYMKRIGGDTDSPSDWVAIRPGMTEYVFDPNLSFKATISPFSFPECEGIPVLKTLESAKRTVDLNIYQLTSTDLVALLCKLEGKGVEVRVLLEGTPTGQNTIGSTSISLMASLSEAGGEVRLINVDKSVRYTYDHAKYMVIDGTKVVITSENYTSGNFSDQGNRGWGAVIEGEGYAKYMEKVFENDFSMEWGDVVPFEKAYTNVKGEKLTYNGCGSFTFNRYSGTVSPVLSPDYSLDALEAFIGSARNRLYVEQMDLGSSLSSVRGDTPVAWMIERSDNGVDVRYILDASQADRSTHQGYVDDITACSSVKAITVNGNKDIGYSLIHNKGVIVDDSVWIGSINWTDTSFSNNRETAVIIDSRQVSEFFVQRFMDDFGKNAFTVEDEGVVLSVEFVSIEGVTAIRMDVDGPEGVEYRWEPGDGNVRVTSFSSVLFDTPPIGTYIAKVTVVGTDIQDTVTYTVDETTVETADKGGFTLTDYTFFAAAIVFSIGSIAAILRDRAENRRLKEKASQYRWNRY